MTGLVWWKVFIFAKLQKKSRTHGRTGPFSFFIFVNPCFTRLLCLSMPSFLLLQHLLHVAVVHLDDVEALCHVADALSCCVVDGSGSCVGGVLNVVDARSYVLDVKSVDVSLAVVGCCNADGSLVALGCLLNLLVNESLAACCCNLDVVG